MNALPRDEHIPTSDRLAVWRSDPARQIIVGAKYQPNPEITYCWLGCDTCVPGTAARCWQRRTELEFTYRVRALHFTDYAHGLGRIFIVTLVRPTIWQLRAFCMGGSLANAMPPERWHTVTGLVSEAKLGVRVE